MIDPVSKSRATVYSNDSKKSAEGTRRKKRDEEIAFFGTDDLVLVNLLTFIHSIHSSASRNALYVYPSIYVHIRIYRYMQVCAYIAGGAFAHSIRGKKTRFITFRHANGVRKVTARSGVRTRSRRDAGSSLASFLTDDTSFLTALPQQPVNPEFPRYSLRR